MIKDTIFNELENILVIDTHEHMLPPKYHKNMNYSFWDLMIPYVQFDLVNAGMSNKFMWKNNLTSIEIEECFNEFIKYWKYVKYGGWGNHVVCVLNDNFGIDDIDAENYVKIGELLNETKQPNHYIKIFREQCHIETVLNQSGDEIYTGEDSYFKGYADVLKNGIINDITILKNEDGKSVESLIELLAKRLYDGKAKGSLFTKFDSSCFMYAPDRTQAEKELNSVLSGETVNTEILQSYVYTSLLSYAEELGLICAVHTGVWDNIYRKSPQHLFKIVEKHNKVKFDVYHMGIPFVRECAFLGKNFPNVSLNLCWSHIVSPATVKNSLDEWLDLVPINKIFAFGGDHTCLPINVPTHLRQAKQNLAEVFSKRVERGEMSVTDAVKIIKMWFYDNPKNFYRL